MFKDKIYGHIIYLLRIIFFFIIHLLRRFLIKLSIEKRFENRPVEEGEWVIVQLLQTPRQQLLWKP